MPAGPPAAPIWARYPTPTAPSTPSSRATHGHSVAGVSCVGGAGSVPGAWIVTSQVGLALSWWRLRRPLAALLGSEGAGINRFTSDAQLAHLAGCAPIPVSSGRSDRYRLDPGGNRRLNSAFYMLAIIRISHDPRTAVYLAKQRQNGKTKKEAICLT